MTASWDLRKAVPFLVYLLFVVFCASGDDAIPSWTFNSESGLVFVYGEAEEIVYKTSSGTDLLSLLVYPVPPSLGVYVGMEGRWRDFMLARIRLETAWPLKSGNITNDDWINVSSFLEDPDVHSDSIAYMTGWIRADFELGFPGRDGPFLIETLIGLRYRNIAWEGWDAYQVSSIYSTKFINGQVLDYRQTWVIPWIGLASGYETGNFLISFSFRLSPWMHVVGRDIHTARFPDPATTYIDDMRGGSMLATALKFEWKIARTGWLVTDLSVDHAKNARGTTFSYANGTSVENIYKNGAGASSTILSAYLGLKVRP